MFKTIPEVEARADPSPKVDYQPILINHMSYMDTLTAQVEALFAETDDLDALKEQVLNLLQEKSKESFKNGLQMSRVKQPKAGGFKGKRS